MWDGGSRPRGSSIGSVQRLVVSECLPPSQHGRFVYKLPVAIINWLAAMLHRLPQMLNLMAFAREAQIDLIVEAGCEPIPLGQLILGH